MPYGPNPAGRPACGYPADSAWHENVFMSGEALNGNLGFPPACSQGENPQGAAEADVAQPGERALT